MERTSLEPRNRPGSQRAGTGKMTDLARCSVELEAIRDAMAVLAVSRLADTAAWVQTSWLLAQAEGALRRATARGRMSPPLGEDLASAIRSAWAALHDLESLGQGAPQWPAGRGDR
jgi:hypothetical protein